VATLIATNWDKDIFKWSIPVLVGVLGLGWTGIWKFAGLKTPPSPSGRPLTHD
jgi:hypothetical protein